MKPVDGKIAVAGINGAFLFDQKSGRVQKTLYPYAVLGMRTEGSKVFIGFNRGFIEYDLKKNDKTTHEMLFRQVRRDDEYHHRVGLRGRRLGGGGGGGGRFNRGGRLVPTRRKKQGEYQQKNDRDSSHDDSPIEYPLLYPP
jgi:hypothetical protein